MEKKEMSLGIKILLGVILILIIVGIVTVCAGYFKKKNTQISNPIVTMEVENYGTIKIELYPDKAPNTVKNFVKLAENGYYDGLKFHRIVKDFMIQGGDSAGTGAGQVTLKDLNEKKAEKENTENKSSEENTENNDTENSTTETTNNSTSEAKDSSASEAYTIKGEMMANNFEQNDLNLTEGVIAMARADYTGYSATLAEESYNSAGSQFFIMTSNEHTNISGYYAGFGKVIEGMDVVKKISEAEVKASDDSEDTGNTEVSTPVNDIIMKSVKVDTFGVDYGMPETQKPFDLMTWFYSYYGLAS